MTIAARDIAARPGPAEPPRIAVYAPMKPPDDPVPSGDREIARLTMAALAAAGFAPELVSRLKLRDGEGSAAAQARLVRAAEAEADRLAAALAPAPPAAWLTYHCYWKAPDLLGPAVADRLGIPYAITEPSISPKRRTGPWAGFAARAEAAIARADRLFWSTARDRTALEMAGHGGAMVHLPPFLEAGPPVAPRPARPRLRLLTVAMMRPGDKLESYRRLAAGLAHLAGDWQLRIVGTGPAADAVGALFAPLAARVRWLGPVADPLRLRAEYAAADLLLWPGVAEGVGMAWLEAQSAGLPVVAEDGPAARACVAAPLAPPDDAPAYAAAIAAAAAGREALSAAARARIEARHSLEAAARLLGAELGALIARR
ncbi:glycosyltransferase family 4 protein [Paralimibaculum aggregatum]|uniref:Glycosyltransferase family 4 protein n=1 Tax=Paralimibaculum aggregatum TaxID=3036245 RepID=A0ABQ6LI66_9RHOB|nr:glycosyltransferase [Limibaculum sp. NKW23]GMG81834.1 glycosyltransferase family 4 protein [Limibaculum sp. NKW23]